MDHVTIRDLRNHGGTVVDRVVAGERLTVTRDGRPVAELRPIHGLPPATDDLLTRWRRLRSVDPVAVRADIDSIIDPRL